MSSDRTTVSVKRDHIAMMNTLFKWDGTKHVAQPEVFFNTPNIAVNMGDFVGALNKADREQYPPSTPPVPAPAPTPGWNPPTEVHENTWRGTRAWGSLSIYSEPFLTAKAPIENGNDPRMFGDKWLVFAVTVPAQRSVDIMSVNCAEWPVAPAPRHLTVSRYPGDFREADPTGVNGPFVRSHGNTANVRVSVGKELIVGETYYVNIRSWSIDLQEYAVGKCEMIVQFNWPKE